MPADPSVDLAALDALYQAATDTLATAAGCTQFRIVRGKTVRLCHVSEEAILALQHALAALDLPALRRRLEIGDAAVAWAEKALAHWDLSNKTIHAPNGAAELERKSAEVEIDLAHLSLEAAVALGEYDAARAKLRALREAQNG